MSDESKYTELELAGLNEWHQLHNDLLPEDPFKFHFMKLRSGSQELRDLIMDPLETLLGRRALPALEGVTEESRITTTLLHAMKSREKRFGLATLCISGGMGLSLLVERA